MKRYAAIDIGAHAVKLKIVERSNTAKIKVLEDIIHPLMLGNKVYEHHKLQPRDIDEIAQTLVGFKRLLLEYKVDNYRAVATSVIRSAENGRFAMAILSQRLNMHIEILEEPVERFLTYAALERQLEDYDLKRREGLLVVEVGSMSAEVILYKDNKLVRNNELQLGTIPLKKILNSMRRVSLYPDQIVADHVYAQTANLQGYLVRQQISHVALVGADIRRLKALLNLPIDRLTSKEFESLKLSLIKGDRELKRLLADARLDADEVLVALLIFDQFVQVIAPSFVDMPSVALRDGMIISQISHLEDFDRDVIQTKDVISCARYMAKRHHGTMSHIRQLEKICIKLFDTYKKSEDFTDKDLLCLRLAAILHETGKFTRQSNYHIATYQSIALATILGLTQATMTHVALIAMQSFSFGEGHHLDADIITEDASIKEIKLGLLLALADASDKSKRQGIKLRSATIVKDSLALEFIGEDAYLEEWAIRSLQESFFDVFGHKIDLLIKETL